MNEKNLEINLFKSPLTCLIAGPTQSGKTTLLENILLKNSEMIKPEIKKIIYCYSRWQSKYDYLKKVLDNISFNEGLFDIDLINTDENTLLILDDLCHLCEKDDTILNLFTTDSHQKNISVFFYAKIFFLKENTFVQLV